MIDHVCQEASRYQARSQCMSNEALKRGSHYICSCSNTPAPSCTPLRLQIYRSLAHGSRKAGATRPLQQLRVQLSEPIELPNIV